MTDAVMWQKEHFAKPYEVFNIKAVDEKQKELGRVLSHEEFDEFVYGYRCFGKSKGFTAVQKKTTTTASSKST
jgi:hypothetical protein